MFLNAQMIIEFLFFFFFADSDFSFVWFVGTSVPPLPP